MKTITLPDLIERLRPPGRYASAECDYRSGFNDFYELLELDDDGLSRSIELFFLDDEAQEATHKCGHCADANERTEDGLAYGPFCSTYSHADNIERNTRIVDSVVS